MSRFGDRYQANFARLLEEVGDPVVYIPHPDDTPSAPVNIAFAIVGDEQTAERQNDYQSWYQHERFITISVEPTNPQYSGVATPKENATVAIGSDTYQVEIVPERSAEGTVELKLEKKQRIKVRPRNVEA